jgi:DNA polymerase I-like protein with 3'-5' exonuclease and polymerase domains
LNITILDVENTTTTKNNKLHLDPYEWGNTLVMVGVHELNSKNTSTYIFDHNSVTPDDDLISNHFAVQSCLDRTDILVCHNVSHDLIWLWESGFKYDKDIYDTMLAQYILNQGITKPLGLAHLAKHYKCQTLKQDTLKNYFSKGYSTKEIPRDELETYLIHDVLATKEIYEKQIKELKNSTLLTTVQLTNEVAIALTKMYKAGFKIDKNALAQVRKEFVKEKISLEKSLQTYTKHLMGDTPINLSSPEQLSWVLFSRKPRNKKVWAEDVKHWCKNDADFRNLIKLHFITLYKTKAEQCSFCKGKGSFYKKRKDGSLFKKATKCSTCNGLGYVFVNTKNVAGLKFNPSNLKWSSANGFKTSKDILEVLEKTAQCKDMQDAQKFLHDLKRLSAVSSYLSNYIEGIENFVKDDGFLHVKLNQHVTATGRLSGSNPNMQNMPRASTFPIKKVFVSRFKDGQIIEADFAQLEFRVAAFLSQDPVAIKEVKEGFDVHSYTAKVISDAGQPITRQEAKAHTFAPLYGATGFGRTPAEAKYYTHFLEKYQGITNWHKCLAKSVLRDKELGSFTGRRFSFPNVERRRDGSVTYSTQIKNYPVQSTATADIVPLLLVLISNALEKYETVVVNTVHDSVILDVKKEEVNDIIELIRSMEGNLVNHMKARWVLEDWNVPLKLDMKIGDNWLDMINIK